MSIRVMTDVWDNCKLSGSALLIVLAMADYCNDDRKCWPATKTLAHKARLSQRHTQRIIARLEEAGYVTVYRNASEWTTNIYELPSGARMAELGELEGTGEFAWHDDGEDDEGVTLPSGGDSDVMGGGDSDVMGGVTLPSSNPSSIRHSEPSSLATPGGVATRASAPATPTTFGGWIDLLRIGRNRNATLRRMFETLYPDHDPPEYSYLGRIARSVGGASRLAQLMWENAARPPVGDVLAYLLAIVKREKAQAVNEPAGYAGIRAYLEKEGLDGDEEGSGSGNGSAGRLLPAVSVDGRHG